MHSTYLRNALDPKKLKEIIDSTVERLNERDSEFDAICFRGMSGALVAPAVAAIMGKKILMVRKQHRSHSIYSVEGDLSATKYVVVDDFIHSGDTLRAIKKEVDETYAYHASGTDKAEMVGVACYMWHYNIEDSAYYGMTVSKIAENECFVIGTRPEEAY